MRDAVIEWGADPAARTRFNCCLPVVAETWDGDLNDIYGFHVKKEHVFAALDRGRGRARWPKGNVGGGTGMMCLGFKGGIGTASRRLAGAAGRLHRGRAGAVQLRRCGGSCGSRAVPVGQEIR